MAQCRWCDKQTGELSNNGLCRGCDSKIVKNIQSRVKDIGKRRDQLRNPQQSTTVPLDKMKEEQREAYLLDFSLRRLGEIIHHFKALDLYAQKGIPTITPLPSEAIKIFSAKREEEILSKGVQLITRKADALDKEVPDSLTLHSLFRLIEDVKSYMAMVKEPEKFHPLQDRVSKRFLEGFQQWLSMTPSSEDDGVSQILDKTGQAAGTLIIDVDGDDE